jgi:hypothetical protein
MRNRYDSYPIVTNCTFSGNAATRDGGIDDADNCISTVTNCILWGDTPQEIHGKPMITFSDVQGGWPGEGNINADPFFVSPGYRVAGNPRTGGHDVWIAGDYHLKSEAGRWDPDSETWVEDDMTSPCINAGDPNSLIAFEPFPNGGIINVGAYGGTAEASKSFSGLYEKYGGGTGEPSDPYLIYTAEQMNAIGAEPNDWDRHFQLMADLDLSAFSYDTALIAPDTDMVREDFQGTPFTGVLDGNGHTISHLTIVGESYLGLLGKLDPGATILNLGLEAVDVNGTRNYVGGLVGDNSGGGIATSYSTGTVSGSVFVGGLVGTNDYGSGITTSYSTAVVSGDRDVGGLVGSNGGSIVTSYSTGTVSGSVFVAGLVGFNFGSITTSYSTGTVTGNVGVGGLVGDNYGDGHITSSFWDVESSGFLTSDGGIGKTTAEMQTASTFLEAGWDFVDETANGTDDIWWILEGQDYPRLWWEEQPTRLQSSW